MPTTFTVFSLGNLADIDTTEGNTLAENAAALVGGVFGGPGNALLNGARTFAPGSTGFGGGTTTAYDQTNAPAEAFTINGGPNQIFDSSAIYNAVITYSDGTTATVTAVIFQDTAGNTYWAPEFSANADQAAMQAGPIQSLTLSSLSGATFSGLTADRQSWTAVTCYVRGTRILTATGERAIETLAPGDLVQTRDNGLQPLRWIGQSAAVAMGKLAPVCIRKGALGPGIPLRDLYVSRQHRILVHSRIAKRMFGASELLVPAIRLVDLPGVDKAPAPRPITYFHLLTDRHEVIFAEGAPSETLLTGPGARKAMGPDAVDEIEALLPGILDRPIHPARPLVRNARLTTLIARHAKHGLHMSPPKAAQTLASKVAAR